MANELQIFNNPTFGKLRTVEMDGEPWLAGKDVAEALGYKNSKDALAKHVDEEDKRLILRSQIATLENYLPKNVFPADFVTAEIPNRGLTFINESGVYALVFGSKLPQAKEFKRWVTSEVLPAIRKHGGYLTPEKVQEALMNPDVLIQLATQLKAEQERNKALQATAERLERDRDFLIEKRNTTTAAIMVKKRTSRTHSDFTITELAEVWELSAKRLRDVLKEEGWLMQIDGKGFHYPTLKAPQGALYIEQTSYFSKLSQTVRISPYGVQCVKQLLKDRGLLGWYM